MLKNLFLFSLLCVLTLPSCSPLRAEKMLSETTTSSDIVLYTDDKIEGLIEIFAFLSTGEYGPPSPENALELLEVDINDLEVLDRWIGDCYDGTAYNLSPSYQLLVDHNACFGLKVWIERKNGSG